MVIQSGAGVGAEGEKENSRAGRDSGEHFPESRPPLETLLCVHFNLGLKHVGTRMYSYQGLSPGFSKNKQDAFVPQVSVEALLSIQIGKDHAKL